MLKSNFLLFLALLLVSPCFGQQKYQRQMTRNHTGCGEDNDKSGKDRRYGFSFQPKETYAYLEMAQDHPNLIFARAENRRWGMVDSLNNQVLPFAYALMVRYVHGDYFLVNWEGKMGVLTSGLKPRYAFAYDDLLCYKEDNCLALKNGRWGVIRSGDEVVIPFKYRDINFGQLNGYEVKTENGWGLVDSLGAMVIPATYDELIRTGLNGYQLARSGNKYALHHLASGKVETLDIEKAIVERGGGWSGLARKEKKFGVVQPGETTAFIYDEVGRMGSGNGKGDLLYKVRRGNHYGIFSSKNGLITEVAFTSVQYFQGKDGVGRVILGNDEQMQLISATGEIIIPPTKEGLRLISYRGTIAEGSVDLTTKIISENGEELLSGAFTKVEQDENNRQILRLETQSGWLLYDRAKQRVVVRDVLEVVSLQPGYFSFRTPDGWNLCPAEGPLVGSRPYNGLSKLVDGNSRLRYSNFPYFRTLRWELSPEGELGVYYGLIDGNGQEVLPTDYQRLRLNADSSLTTVQNELGRLFDLKTRKFRDSTFTFNLGRKRTTEPVNTPRPMDKGPAASNSEVGQELKAGDMSLVRRPEGWKLKELKKKQVQLPDGITHLDPKRQYKMIARMAFFIWREGKVGVINDRGEVIIPPIYDDLAPARQRSGVRLVYSCARKKEKYALINRLGKEITPFRYDEIRAFQGGMARVRIGEKWGFINPNGQETIPAKYAIAQPFEFGLSKVTQGAKTFFVDKENVCRLGCD